MEFFNHDQLPPVPPAVHYFCEIMDRALAPDDDTYTLLHYLDLAQNPEAAVDDFVVGGHASGQLIRTFASVTRMTIFFWYRQINRPNIRKIQHHSLSLKLSPPISEMTSFAIGYSTFQFAMRSPSPASRLLEPLPLSTR